MLDLLLDQMRAMQVEGERRGLVSVEKHDVLFAIRDWIKVHGPDGRTNCSWMKARDACACTGLRMHHRCLTNQSPGGAGRLAASALNSDIQRPRTCISCSWHRLCSPTIQINDLTHKPTQLLVLVIKRCLGHKVLPALDEHVQSVADIGLCDHRVPRPTEPYDSFESGAVSLGGQMMHSNMHRSLRWFDTDHFLQWRLVCFDQRGARQQ